MKRKAIYALYAPGGRLRAQVVEYVRGLREVAGEVWVVANGGLQAEGVARLEALGVRVLQRENTGLDFAAWKHALEHIGYEQVAQADELLLCNCSCYGPVYPFAEVFEAMAARHCDLWGLYRHSEVKGRFPAHLQSYFLVLRKTVLVSDAFRDYWRNMQVASDWDAAVSQEVRFTEYFEQRGFVSSAYVEPAKYDDLALNPTVPLPVPLLRAERFPLLKRKAFTEEEKMFHYVGNASQAREAIELVRKAGKLPVEVIYEDLLEDMPASRLRKMLQLVYSLPDGGGGQMLPAAGVIVINRQSGHTADLGDYLRHLPVGTPILVLTDDAEAQQLWRRDFPAAETRLVDGDLLDSSGYLLACRDWLRQHEWLCLVRDDRLPAGRKLHPMALYSYLHQCWQSVLGLESGYVEQLGALVKREPHLGLLLPPPPLFARWHMDAMQRGWGEYEPAARALLQELELRVPFDDTPDVAYGGVCWLRREVLEALFSAPESWLDAPAQDAPAARLTLVERLLPQLAQAAGYTSGVVMPSMLNAAMQNLAWTRLEQYADVAAGRGEETVKTSMVTGTVRSWVRRKMRKRRK